MKKLILLFMGMLYLQVSFSQTTMTLNNLPLQTNINEGATVMYTFDQPIDAVASRNLNIVSWQIAGSTITFKGLKNGRTGLKITAGSTSYYLGMRVNKSNGALPGMPDYVSIASVSEDISGDLQFWKDVQPGAKNKSMDVRYIYINGGPINGWHSWGKQRPGQFARESLRHGLIPFFVYYNIPADDESYAADLKNAQDPTYMTAYFKDLNIFMDSVENVMKGELYGIILEPDFLGYMQQNAVPNDPTTIKTAVGATTIAANAGNISTLVARINATIQAKRNTGSNIFYGWQQNLWATPNFQGPQGICRRTDDNSFAAGKYLIKYSAREATMYQMKAGVLTHGADFISIDKYGLDAMGTNANTDPAQVTWFWNNDHWNNYLLYCKTIHETSDKPVILWQLPVGRINQSNYKSAYTGAPYADMPNTAAKYEDSSTDFFLGDSINTTDAVRTNYFNQNKWNDGKLIQKGNMISWGRHIKECKDAGIICVQFGAGVGASTDGIGNPPSDNYFWIQKVQSYYLNGTIPLDHSYPDIISCSGNCAPIIKFITPLHNGYIYRSNLDTAQLNFSAWDNDGSIASLTATVDGSITLPTNVNAVVQQLNWIPPTSFGPHTLKVSATDNNGLITTQTITFTIVKTDPVACGYPEWDANTTYATINTMVIYNGLIFKSKYWTKGDKPYMGGSSTPWTLEGVCPGNDINTIISKQETEAPFFVYPNPTNGMVYFNAKTGTSGELSILDVKGAVLYKGKISAGGNEIDLHQFSQGIYFMQIQLNDNVYYQKLIRQ
jgi:hypothetical protein